MRDLSSPLVEVGSEVFLHLSRGDSESLALRGHEHLHLREPAPPLAEFVEFLYELGCERHLLFGAIS